MSYILSKTCQNCPTLAQTGSWEAGQALIHMCRGVCWGGVEPRQSAAAMCQTCSLFGGMPFILLACFVFTSCWPTLRSWSNPPGSFHGWLGWSTLLCLSLIRISDSRRRSLQKKKREREKKTGKSSRAVWKWSTRPLRALSQGPGLELIYQGLGL